MVGIAVPSDRRSDPQLARLVTVSQLLREFRDLLLESLGFLDGCVVRPHHIVLAAGDEPFLGDPPKHQLVLVVGPEASAFLTLMVERGLEFRRPTGALRVVVSTIRADPGLGFQMPLVIV
jgi:hypothetical protein